MRRVLVTGANRGIGLESARQLLARGDRVFATARRPERAQALARLHEEAPDALSVLRLDVIDLDSIRAAAERVRSEAGALDWLINNAAILPKTPETERLGRLDPEAVAEVLRVNAVGALTVTQAFLPLLRRGERPLVASLTSGWGSVSEAAAGWPYAYCASKSALNMLMRILAAEAISDGIVSVLVDPGWVGTDMGGPNAPVTPEESVRALIAVLDRVGPRDAGRLLDRRGSDRPW